VRVAGIILARAGSKGVPFAKLFAERATKLDLIVTFLAILELMRLQKIAVSQREAFGRINVRLARKTKKS